MAYQSNAPSQKPYELKPRTGSMFKNPDFNPQGDLDDTNNYWGNGKIMESDGTLLSFRVYAKVGKESGKPYWKLSMYDPQPQEQQQQVQYNQQAPANKMPWDD
jgi:hypothetical protein